MVVIIGLILTFLASVAVALATYLASRRVNSGAVKSSDAGELWTQTQKLIDTLQHDKDRAEDQRDKLLDLTTNVYTPAVQRVVDTQKQMLEMLEGIEQRLTTHEDAEKE